MAKTRVGVLLRESVGGNKSTNKSTDLAKLTAKYQEFTTQMRRLIEGIKAHHESMIRVEQTRTEVSKQFASLTKQTPLYDCIGLMPSADRPSHTVCSYSSVHDEVSAKAKSYAGKYQQFVLEYALEWEKVVRTRIDNGIKKAEELRIELDHYQKKVESMRLSANQSMARGKPVSSAAQEKLTRNEEKLIASKQNYNRVATDLCILMEEVTERSWRDLHPLLVKCAQFDMTLANDEAKALNNLNQVVGSLKQVATEHGLSPQPRLKDLAGLKPEMLSTRPGGVAGYHPMLENGGGLSSPLSFDPTALAPGSVGPQGMGGFPVQIATTDGGYQRSASMTSYSSAPLSPPSNFDPMSALVVSTTTAPAPTLDDVYGGGSGGMYGGGPSSNSTRSAPSSGNFAFSALSPSQYQQPPPIPDNSSGNNWNVRSSSFNDADSAYSGYAPSYGASAPPPMPPPTMPPPPPPPSSGGMLPPSYGGSGGYATAASPWTTAAPPSAPMSYYNSNPTGGSQPPPPLHSQPSQSNYNPFG